MVLSVTMAAAALLTAAPRSSHALSTCNALLRLAYLSGPNFPSVGDTIRVRLTLGTGSIANGTTFTVNRVRFDLDCAAPPPPGPPPGQVGCTDDGSVVGYQGDATITSTCPGVKWSTGHAKASSPNEVVFTPSQPIAIPASTGTFCALEFDVQVVGRSNDGTPDVAEEVAGFDAAQLDGQCDNQLASSGSQAGSIPLCQVCNDGDACTDDVCNSETNKCISTAVTCNDNDLCTSDTCDPASGCVFTPTVTCDDPTCEECKPDTGMCEARSPLPVSCRPIGCRVTGGGIVAMNTGDAPDPGPDADIRKGTFGGQVGAPCGCLGCFDEFDNIQGSWQHSRKKHQGNFHAKNYLSLICGCDEGTSVTPAVRFKGQTCGNREIGPTPRRAPANLICFTGVGNYTETVGRRTTEVAFRVEIEDRGEPGAGQNSGPSADVYRISLWIPTDGETTMGLAEQACCSNTPAHVRTPDVHDGGDLIHGNLQIHPATPLTNRGICPPPDACMSPLP